MEPSNSPGRYYVELDGLEVMADIGVHRWEAGRLNR